MRMGNTHFSFEEVRAAFREAVAGIDFQNGKGLERLAYTHARETYPWFSSACTLFGGNTAWYAVVAVLLRQELGFSGDDAERILGRIKSIGQRRSAEAVRARSLKFTAEEVRRMFRKEAAGFIPGDPSTMARFTHTRARAELPWGSSACSLFGNSPSDWYGAFERLLVLEAGRSENQAQADVARLREYANSERFKKITAKNLKFTEAQVREEFRELLRGLDLSDASGLLAITHGRVKN